MSLLESAQLAARYYVQEWAQIAEGEQVLMLQTQDVAGSSPASQVLEEACRRAGARTQRLVTPTFNPRIAEPPDEVTQAICQADVVVFLSPYAALLHSQAGRKAMIEYGTRIAPVLTYTLEELASPWALFPPRLQLKMHGMCWDLVTKGAPIAVRSRSGTEITGSIGGPIVTIRHDRLVHGLGWHGIWPGEVGPCIEPLEHVNGTLVVDAVPGYPPLSAAADKLRLRVVENRIVEIEGGPVAGYFRELVERSVASGGDGDHLVEIQWGLNPKGRLASGLRRIEADEIELSRVARTVHFGFGTGTNHFHWDLVLIDGFDITVGTTVVYRQGRLTLLDHPEVRALAAEYGPPDEILREVSTEG